MLNGLFFYNSKLFDPYRCIVGSNSHARMHILHVLMFRLYLSISLWVKKTTLMLSPFLFCLCELHGYLLTRFDGESRNRSCVLLSPCFRSSLRSFRILRWNYTNSETCDAMTSCSRDHFNMGTFEKWKTLENPAWPNLITVLDAILWATKKRISTSLFYLNRTTKEHYLGGRSANWES